MAEELLDRADESIRHQIELESFKSGESSKMKTMLDHLNEDVADRLDELNDKIINGQSKAFYTQSRLEKMTKRLNDIIEKGYTDIHATATRDNRKLVENEIEWAADVLLSGIEDITVPTTRQVFASVDKNPFQGWVKQGKAPMTYANSSPLRGVEKQYIKDMERSLKTSYLAGATTRDAEKRLQKINSNIARRNKDYNKALRNTESETRTALQTYANRAMEQTIRENGVEWELFLATLDLRTTEVCGSLDGTRWNLDDTSRPQIPVHWMCRSIYVPLFDKDEKIEGIRPQTTPGPTYQKGDKFTSTGKVRKARRGDGSLKRSQISTDMDLNSWLSRQDRTDPQFVQDYFGSQKKYDDWKSGKLGKVTYFDNRGKKHSIDSLRFKSLGDNVSAAPSLEMRSSNPSKYFLSKGGSKPISKKLDTWNSEKDGTRKLQKENDIVDTMNKGVLGRRISDPKRVKAANETLKGIEFINAPSNADISIEDFKEQFINAVALYGTKVKGIKKVRFDSIAARSNIEDGLMIIDNNASNVHREVGRFIAHNDDAYLQASKYFSTVDIDEVVADGFSNFKNSTAAFSLYKTNPEKFKFMMGIIDDKPKKIKIATKSPEIVTKNKVIKPVNKDNAVPAHVGTDTLSHYTKLAESAPVTRALSRLTPKKKKLDKLIKQEMKKHGVLSEFFFNHDVRTGKIKLDPKLKALRDSVLTQELAVRKQIDDLIIKKRIQGRLAKFKKVSNTELDGKSPTTRAKNIGGKTLSNAKDISAEAMALLNQRPASFRHLVKKGSRASANKYDQYVNIGSGGRGSIYHEIGHHVEFSNPNVKKAAQEFRDKKSTGKIRKLKDIFPKQGYDDWERVLEDEFISPYVGKIYEDGDTEVVSMGLEQFSNAQTIMQFFLKDPEHFKFIFGMIKEYDKLP